MRFFAYALLLSLGPCAFAQEPVAAITGDQPVIALYGRIAVWADRLEPMLAQMKTADWVAQGASETYSQQAASALVQLKAVRQDMTEMQRSPDALQDALKALFRVDGFQRTLNSVLAGLRRYQNPALADLIVAVGSEVTPELQALEAHLLEVAGQRESACQVVEKEAQRCRGMISREPVARPPVSRAPVHKP